MTYKEFIDNILNTRGRFACGDKYHERHHIVPRCMGGGDDEENLIDLFAREHFMAHKLLVDENPDNESLILAYACMAFVKRNDTERYELTPEEYEEAKIILSETISNRYTGEGNPFYGKRHTEEAKQKIRESNLGRVYSEETRKKMSNSLSGENNPMYGKRWSQERIDNISIKMSGENNPMYGISPQERMDEETYELWRKHLSNSLSGVNNPNYGKRHSEETKIKISETSKGRTHSEETKKKQSNSHRGKTWTDTQREKMSGKNHFNYGTGKCVIQLSLNDAYIIEYISANEAYKTTGISASSILQCCNHTKWRKTAGGFKWIYKEEYEKLNDINGGYKKDE